MPQSICTTDNCERKTLARGMCSTHYSYWHRANNNSLAACEQCGTEFRRPRPSQVMCSIACASAKAVSLRPEAQPKQPRMSPAERRAVWDSRRTDLRSAYEEARWGDFIAALYLRSTVNPEGCWEWQGALKQSTKSKSPYPVQRWSGKVHQVHRLALEAKHGLPLGTQQAHHVCANTICVNPEHLQPATHVENIAEMKARKSYEDRIKELEHALRGVAPQHEALGRIEYGAA